MPTQTLSDNQTHLTPHTLHYITLCELYSEACLTLLSKVKQFIPNIKQFIPNIKQFIPNIKQFIPNIKQFIPNIKQLQETI